MISLIKTKKMNIKHKFLSPKSSGFSLIEVLAVIAIASISLAITIPNLLVFVERQKLSSARQELYQAIRSTQSEASRRKQNWQISVKQTSDGVLWAKHPASTPINAVSWNNLGKNIEIDISNSDRSTSTRVNDIVSRGYYWRFRFDDDGNFFGKTQDELALAPAKITIKLSNSIDQANFAKGCIFIDTIIGAMRQEKDTDCQ